MTNKRYAISYQLMIFVPNMKMLKDIFHAKISVERAARVATCVWEEQVGRPSQGQHQCFQVFGLRAHFDVYVTYKYVYRYIYVMT